MMKYFIKVAVLLCVVTILLSALSFKTSEAKAAPSSGKMFQNGFTSTACGKWSVVTSPNSNVVPDGLSGVAAVSAGDIWAVGGAGSQMSGGQTLIEHWDGAHWQIVTSPNPGSTYNHLDGVTADSATDAWAVGYYVSTTGVTQTLIEHWNGTSWSVVKSPSPASINNELYSVAAISASDVWAVGFVTINTSGQTPVDQTLIEHWNGSSWSVVKSPNPGSGGDHLSAVAAISASDVWAVGDSNTLSKTLTEHWNGSHWSVVSSPNPGSGGVLHAVAAVSAGDVWATGYAIYGNSIQTLVEHWNGTSWRVVKSPNVGTSPALWAVTAVSANDVWAVGSNNNSNNVFQTLAEQWNGKQWSVVKSLSPGSFNNQLLGVAAVSANDVWAVGHADSTTLTEHYHC